MPYSMRPIPTNRPGDVEIDDAGPGALVQRRQQCFLTLPATSRMALTHRAVCSAAEERPTVVAARGGFWYVLGATAEEGVNRVIRNLDNALNPLDRDDRRSEGRWRGEREHREYGERERREEMEREHQRL